MSPLAISLISEPTSFEYNVILLKTTVFADDYREIYRHFVYIFGGTC